MQTNADELDVMSSHEGGDVFTLIHHELNICTNSVNSSTLFVLFIFIISFCIPTMQSVSVGHVSVTTR